MTAYCEIDLPAGAGRLTAAFVEPAEVLVAHRPEEVPDLLARVEALAAAGCWLVGFVAYEAAAAFDPALAAHAPPEGLPLAAFAAYRAPSPPRPRGDFLWGPWRDATDRAGFDAAVGAVRRDIAAGRFYQVNYTTRLGAAAQGDALALFDALRAAQAGAHSVFLDFGRWRVCSVSPELFFHWHPDDGSGRRLATRPMKGTAPRHADPARDRQAAAALRASEKEQAENLMIVDLLRNDLSRVARLGSVAVPELFTVEAWPTVWQMTSAVECRTRPEVGLVDVFTALFPCGSVTGAPKAEAMKAITELEPEPRGVYCGAVGVVIPSGEAHKQCAGPPQALLGPLGGERRGAAFSGGAYFNVAIRTAVVDGATGRAECGIGSGIVLDSTPAGEWAEDQAKQRFLRAACPDYELLETLLWRRGRYWLRREHLARLAASAVALGFVWDRARVEAALDGAVAGFGLGPWRVRLRLAADGSPAIDAEPLAATLAPVTVAWARSAVSSTNPWLRHKTTRRRLYEDLAVPGAFDTLLFNERDEVTEFSRGNLVIRLDGRLLTPALACGLLPGTFRAALLARGTIAEAVITRQDLARTSEIWFVNSLRGALRAALGGDGTPPLVVSSHF